MLKSTSMVRIPAGPEIESFEIGVVPVTQALYRLVMNSTPSYFKGETDLPVEGVSWYDAVAFCNALSKWHGLPEVYHINGQRVVWDSFSKGYRLPTEAEWEYACRAGSSSDPTGEELDAMAWHSGNSGRSTHVVGTKQPNAWYLHDMLGNVWEWCWDTVGSDRVLRGGCWGGGANRARAAARGYDYPDDRDGDLGFRLARSC